MTASEVTDAYKDGRRDFQEIRVHRANFSETDLRGATFYGAWLREADFSGALLTHVQFKGARLNGASFVRSSLNAADLIGGDFRMADLEHCDLTGASMNGSDFRGANLGRANLGNAVFDDTLLYGARFAGAYLRSHISNTGVRPLCDAESIIHTGPSAVDARTVMRSYRHPRLKPFLVACGVPEVFSEYMIECARALGDDVLKSLMRSTFISYGAPDEEFARQLHEALSKHGVVVFFFPESARVGRRIGDEVFDGLQAHDRMVLVCSKASLDRPGVLNEIQETLDRESRDGGASYLIPVMLDDYVLTGWRDSEPILAERVGRRVAADFRGATDNRVTFDRALNRLLDALKKKRPEGANSPEG